MYIYILIKIVWILSNLLDEFAYSTIKDLVQIIVQKCTLFGNILFVFFYIFDKM